jgi:hypothetical protein
MAENTKLRFFKKIQLFLRKNNNMAENTELQLFKNELTRTDITPQELQLMAEQKSVEIFKKIESTRKKISVAEQQANSAKAMETGLFGKTGKKATATANALVATNDALSEMNNLIQESIRFTCSSIQFAQVMHKTMAYMMVNGFTDTNGHLTQLSTDSKKVVEHILAEANDFVVKQLSVEKKQTELNQRLEEKDILDKEQSESIQEIKEELKLGVIHKRITLFLSIIAVAISLVALVFSILK